jgi:carboxymethylenebutenolidase
MEEITFARDGATIRGTLVLPSGAQRHPALVLIPDVRGVSDHFRAIAQRFAEAGFGALVLDLYSREGAPDLPDLDAVFRWIRRLPDRRVLGDVAGAVAYLANRPEVRADAIAVAGFCMGGQYALMAACSGAKVAACVSWYGMLRYAEKDDIKPQSPLDLADRLTCPYLGLFGADDTLIPPPDIEELRGKLTAANKNFTIISYPGAGHAFFNDTRPEMYRPDAARDSWDKALTFLRRNLRPA